MGFFTQLICTVLATHALKLPGKMRLKESRRVPMWNGPIECRLFRFELVAGSARD